MYSKIHTKAEALKLLTAEISEIFKAEGIRHKCIEYGEYVNSPKKEIRLLCSRFNKVVRYQLEQKGLTFDSAFADPDELGFFCVVLEIRSIEVYNPEN